MTTAARRLTTTVFYEVESDGRTVWVHSSEGHTVARFGRKGIDVHTADSTGCLDCTAGSGPGDFTTAADWERFQRSVLSHYGVTVSVDHRPVHIG